MKGERGEVRARTRFLVGIGVLALAAAADTIVAADVVQGRFEGAIEIPGRRVALVVDLAKGERAWSGSATMPDFGLKGVVLKDLSVKEGEVAFSLKGVLGDPRFVGSLGEGGILTGRFEQAGNSAPFALRRSGPPQVEPIPKRGAVGKGLLGGWHGESILGGNPLHVRLSLANKDGAAVAAFHITGHREHDLEVEQVLDENGYLTVRSPDLGGVLYEGRLEADGRTIAGTLHQGPFDGALVLQREAPKAHDPQP